MGFDVFSDYLTTLMPNFLSLSSNLESAYFAHIRLTGSLFHIAADIDGKQLMTHNVNPFDKIHGMDSNQSKD